MGGRERFENSSGCTTCELLSLGRRDMKAEQGLEETEQQLGSRPSIPHFSNR